MREHQRMTDALERMLLDTFLDTLSEEESSELPLLAISKLAETPSYNLLLDVINDPDCLDIIHKFNDFKSEVRKGKLGNTAKFWLSYCDLV